MQNNVRGCLSCLVEYVGTIDFLKMHRKNKTALIPAPKAHYEISSSDAGKNMKKNMSSILCRTEMLNIAFNLNSIDEYFS